MHPHTNTTAPQKLPRFMRALYSPATSSSRRSLRPNQVLLLFQAFENSLGACPRNSLLISQFGLRVCRLRLLLASGPSFLLLLAREIFHSSMFCLTASFGLLVRSSFPSRIARIPTYLLDASAFICIRHQCAYLQSCSTHTISGRPK